jgi:copper(I)-binding protein
MRSSAIPGAIFSLIAAVGLLVGGCASDPLSRQNQPVPPTADIEEAWVDMPPPSATTAEAYMTIIGPAVDLELVRATSPAASRVALYGAVGPSGGNDGRLVPEIPIPATSTVHIGAGGYAVVLEGLTTTLVAGQTVELDVFFDNGVSATVQAEVRP